MSILVLADERVADHRPPAGHPERPERFAAAIDGINAAGFGEALMWRTPSEAPVDKLLRVHSAEHVDQIMGFGDQEHVRLDPDTHALRAGEADSAFCVVRPPGHHATPTTAMGFCLFNNVAVTAQALSDAGEKVAIIDIDAHHGNGTQDAFYDRDDVLFVSFHQYPAYPGTGAFEEQGTGAGVGHTINFPMPPGATGDVYLRAIDQVLEPALEAFGADWVLISAGFDGHRADPITNLGLTSGDYAAICARLTATAAPGRLIAFLEGGYDLDALGLSAAACTGALLGETHAPEAQTNGGPGNNVVDAHLDQNP